MILCVRVDEASAPLFPCVQTELLRVFVPESGTLAERRYRFAQWSYPLSWPTPTSSSGACYCLLSTSRSLWYPFTGGLLACYLPPALAICSPYLNRVLGSWSCRRLSLFFFFSHSSFCFLLEAHIPYRYIVQYLCHSLPLLVVERGMRN
jgi:hypothetical protein